MAQPELMDFDAALEMFEPVVGFEVHVELSTDTKMFSDAPNPAARDEAQIAPNTCITPLCLGLPGSLPVVNKKAVEYSISLGLALGCDIAPVSRFARKNYYYPDLAKNYQISQYDEPIAFEGSVSVELDDGTLMDVPIERAHMEEDAGKLTHVGGATGRIQGAEYSLVDYNRAGELGRAYVSTIRDMVRSLGISHARMERGNLRCDANVSLRPRGSAAYGTRTETKNVNSFRSIERAVRYEIQRQAHILSSGGTITQETRHWHEDTGVTSPGRPKSDADDYRYFPEPDLLPVEATPELVESLRQALPEQPVELRRRLRSEWVFSDVDFQAIVNAGLLSEVHETVAAGVSPTAARKWWMGELSRLANDRGVEPGSIATAHDVKALQTLVDDGRLTDKLAREVLGAMVDGEGTPEEIVAARGLEVVSDDGALLAAIDEALAAQPDVLGKIREGKTQAAGAIIGAVMKAMRGQADAARVQALVIERAQADS